MNSGIYIHIPYCKTKCLYCDFYSGGVRIADWHSYADAIITEFDSRKNELTEIPTTIYIGGGTPSLMPVRELYRIAGHIKKELGVEGWQEFTIEANPEDIDKDKCKDWKEIGVNRISLGIQSLVDVELKLIGRRHSAEDAIRAHDVLRKCFDNISVDIMFGLPAQTVNSYFNTLKEVIKLRPTHISSYSMMLEDGTAMTSLVNQRKVRLPDEEEWMKMFEVTFELLHQSGYHHYEIYNYCLPGYESKHNMGYWLGKQYLGLGPGAHSYDGKRIRRFNPTDLKGYLQFFSSSQKKLIFYSEESLSEQELLEEMIMTRLRTKTGICIEEFKMRFGEKETEILLKKSKRNQKQGNLLLSDGYLRLTDRGLRISNSVMSDLF